MGHSDPDGLARVLKRGHKRHIAICGEVGRPVSPQIHDFPPVLDCQLRGRKRVVRRVQNHIAGSPGPGRRERIIVLRLKGFRIERKGGKVVRVQQYIIILRNAARSWAERAPVCRHLRPLLAVSRNHYPLM